MTLAIRSPHRIQVASECSPRVVKRSRILEEVAEGEGARRYEETELARRAGPARRRLTVLLILGAIGFLIEAVFARAPVMGLGTLVLALVAWGAWSGRLGGVVAAAMAAVLGMFVPIAFMLVGSQPLETRIAMVFVIVWGALLLPSVILLLRDAELQNAYGRWAQRE